MMLVLRKKQYTNNANNKNQTSDINIEVDKINTCTDCNKAFNTLSYYKAHRTKFHKDILKASVATGKPVYQKDLWSSKQSNQSLGHQNLGHKTPTCPGGLKDLQFSDSPTNLIEQ